MLEDIYSKFFAHHQSSPLNLMVCLMTVEPFHWEQL